MPRISIIIPCYNVSAYLIQRCIKSIEEQTFKDYEVIIIDDGSKEDFASVLTKVEENTKIPLKLVKQENRGVSAARNLGVELAIGEYIIFVDADDVLLADSLDNAYRTAVEQDADLVIGGMVDFSDTKPIAEVRKYKNNKNFIFSGKDTRKLFRYMVGTHTYAFPGGKVGQGPWTRLIKIDLAKKISFDTQLAIGEDIVWNLQLLNLASRVCLVEKVWYAYYVSPESSSRRYRKEAIDESILSLKKIRELMNLESDEEYCAYCRRCFSDIKRIYRCLLKYRAEIGGNSEQKRMMLKIYTERPWNIILEKRFLDFCSLKERILCFLYSEKLLFLYYEIKEGKS